MFQQRDSLNHTVKKGESMLTKDKSKILIEEFSSFIQRSELQTTSVKSLRPFVNEIKEILLVHVYQKNEKNVDEKTSERPDVDQ
jgi:hypothetical protein